MARDCQSGTHLLSQRKEAVISATTVAKRGTFQEIALKASLRTEESTGERTGEKELVRTNVSNATRWAILRESVLVNNFL
jgi:hypothetical protein